MTRESRMPGEKPLFWVSSAKADLLKFPEPVKDGIGTALSVEGAVYVLHAFQKKSRRGSKTAITDIELIGKRLRAAQEDYETRSREK